MQTEALLPRESVWPRVAWGVFLVVALVLLLITTGSEVAATFVASSVALILIAWRFPYGMLAVWAPLSFLLGVQIAVSTGYYRIGERTIGATVELSLGEVLAACLIAAWALRVLLLWRGRRDRHWRPLLPLALAFLGLAAAHFLSYFGPGQPALGEVFKHVVRYQLFLYLASIALIVNFIRSKRRLRQVLLGFVIVGVIFAFDGLRSMVVFDGGLPSIRQAQPQAILGINPLAGNQHSLAELLIVSTGAALAFAVLSPIASNRRYLAMLSALFTGGVTVLTFSRTAWIVIAIQVTILFATLWREWFMTHRKQLVYSAVLSSPLVIAMLVYSLTRASLGSLDSRAALTGVAWTFFKGSPIVGVGAGTFAERVGKTYAFLVDFGIPLDSHGIIQKVAAEAGTLGLIALASVFGLFVWYAWRDYKGIPQGRPEYVAYVYLAVTALGVFLYQLTSTSYWTTRLWLPFGLLLAAGHVFREQQAARDPDFLSSPHV